MVLWLVYLPSMVGCCLVAFSTSHGAGALSVDVRQDIVKYCMGYVIAVVIGFQPLNKWIA
jgi:hypothetical protein